MVKVTTGASGKSGDLIRQDDTNFETPLDQVQGAEVPASLFFVRSHSRFPEPISTHAWALHLSGLIVHPIELTYEELRRGPVRTMVSWLECAGNSRARFDPTSIGLQWDDGAVGNATFTGVSLSYVFDRAGGLSPGAREAVISGADGYQRAMPVDLAVEPQVMLVWEMNGQPIPGPNGGPVRLLVPRWGGMASVKWLTGIEIIDRPFDGKYNTQEYVLIDEDGQVQAPVREMPIKSVIAFPKEGAKLPVGTHTVFGFAWSGHAPIAQVQVSPDGGTTWSQARLVPSANPYGWVRWEFDWDPDGKGIHEILCRAADEAGNAQPEEAAWNQQGYLMNAVQRRTVAIA